MGEGKGTDHFKLDTSGPEPEPLIARLWVKEMKWSKPPKNHPDHDDDSLDPAKAPKPDGVEKGWMDTIWEYKYVGLGAVVAGAGVLGGLRYRHKIKDFVYD